MCNRPAYEGRTADTARQLKAQAHPTPALAIAPAQPHLSGGRLDQLSIGLTVIRGLDPRIHPLRKTRLSFDGSPGRARR
jgi:hypothetical protein